MILNYDNRVDIPMGITHITHPSLRVLNLESGFFHGINSLYSLSFGDRYGFDGPYHNLKMRLREESAITRNHEWRPQPYNERIPTMKKYDLLGDIFTYKQSISSFRQLGSDCLYIEWINV